MFLSWLNEVFFWEIKVYHLFKHFVEPNRIQALITDTWKYNPVPATISALRSDRQIAYGHVLWTPWYVSLATFRVQYNAFQWILGTKSRPDNQNIDVSTIKFRRQLMFDIGENRIDDPWNLIHYKAASLVSAENKKIVMTLGTQFWKGDEPTWVSNETDFGTEKYFLSKEGQL